jgi:hypothetical protein
MSNGTDIRDRLYELMPVLYRERDEREGYPLRELLRIVTEQADIVHGDVSGLLDDFFIETCKRWTIPYIGDLVSNRLLHDAQDLESPDTASELFESLVGPDLRAANPVRTRADVAKTIYYRRRKGTLPMLEELARDVTGWAAHAVEFFELLIWNQNLNHLRMHSSGCCDLRSPEAMGRVDGAFDGASHTVDVRYPAQREGWHNIRNIGFFLWRLRDYTADRVVARGAAQPWQFYFSPLGNPAPLFSQTRREGDEAGLATELHVPGPIRRAAFHGNAAEFYGQRTTHSLAIFTGNVQVPLAQIRCVNLDNWAQPTGNVVGLDVQNGRIAFGTTFVSAGRVEAQHRYGFSADIGSGAYPRAKWLVDPEIPALRLDVFDGAVAPAFPTLTLALSEWVAQGRPSAVITIRDNRSYAMDSTITMVPGTFLVIQADNDRRPHIMPNGRQLLVQGAADDAELVLSGLLFEGAVRVGGDLGKLSIIHTTLVPGRALNEDGTPATTQPSVIVNEVDGAGAEVNRRLSLRIASSIVGPVRISHTARELYLLDSIVDGLGDTAVAGPTGVNQSAPEATLERVTLLGRSFFHKLLLATEAIFTDSVVVDEVQKGCVRFSFVPHPSVTPRRHRCQPDLEIARLCERAEQAGTLTPALRAEITAQVRARMLPSFTSIHYGDAGFAQLHLNSPYEIRTGAGDGSEMGVFCMLKQPQRETNLRLRFEEYLPFGLDPGIIYIT